MDRNCFDLDMEHKAFPQLLKAGEMAAGSQRGLEVHGYAPPVRQELVVGFFLRRLPFTAGNNWSTNFMSMVHDSMSKPKPGFPFLSTLIQVFLIGVCLPLYVVHSVDEALKMWDLVATFVCASGIVIAYFADTQLHEFVTRNSKLKMSGESMVPNLEEGLWRYSRHPNYFGEQLWWWGLVIFAWGLGEEWSLVGSLVNSVCLAYVTKLVEERMLKQEYRAEAYRQYQKTTSVWIPWLKTSVSHEKEKNM